MELLVLTIWRAEVDPRRQAPLASGIDPLPPEIRPKVRHSERGRPAAKYAPDLNVTSMRFPIPRSARTWELAVHEACGSKLTAHRLAELADAG